jgi:hypothetical protein
MRTGKADVYKFDDQLPPNHPTQPVFEHCCGQGVNQMNHSIDDKVVKSIGVEGYYYRIHLQFNPQQKSHDHQKNRIHSKALLVSILSLVLVAHFVSNDIRWNTKHSDLST